MADNSRKRSFGNTYLMIIDYPIQAEDGPLKTVSVPGVKSPEHREYCRLMEEIFTQALDAKTLPIYCGGNCTAETLLNTIRSKLDALTEDDLVVLYFHGKAEGRDDYYLWKVGKPGKRLSRSRKNVQRRAPPKSLDAYSVLGALFSCKATSVGLLDCQFPDNVTPFWEDILGFNELIWSGGERCDAEGNVDKEEGEDFTEAIDNALQFWKTSIDNPKKRRNKWFSTIRVMLKDDMNMPFKARGKVIKGKEAAVRSVRVGRSTKFGHKLQFWGKVEAAAGADEDIASEEEGEMDDEGIDMGESLFVPEKKARTEGSDA